MKKRGEDHQENGYTLLELVVVLSILVILVCVAVPETKALLQSARRSAAAEEAQLAADGVRWYLDEKQRKGKLKTKDLFPLIGLELDQPGNVLEEYLGPGQPGARIETVAVDLSTGGLKQLTYGNPYVRVRLTWDEAGNMKIEYPGQEL